MSARPGGAHAGGARDVVRVLAPMTAAQLDAVMAIEVSAYAFPWTRGNFVDSLAAGHPARVLLDDRGAMLGYFVAMLGVDEVHLLNITVAPAAQGRGLARVLIDALVALCREHAAQALWLEVRDGNGHARAIYDRLGFVIAGRRKGYYPAPFGRREDAVVMRLALDTGAPARGRDAAPAGVEIEGEGPLAAPLGAPRPTDLPQRGGDALE